MKILRNLIIIICVFIIGGKMIAQGLPAGKSSSNPSFPVPYQYGNIPVNLSTGAVNINIPLWSASSGNLSVPISAFYQSNGLRPSDLPSILGLSWNLNAGGSIIQIVNGSSGIENQSDITNPSNDFLTDVVNGWSDSEPDIYKVNAPGLSFDFMIKEDNTFLQLTESNIKLKWMSNGGILVSSENGVKYYFEKIITTEFDAIIPSHDENKGDTYQTTYNYMYLLTKMENSNSTNEIIFNYSVTDETDKMFCYGKHYIGETIDNFSHDDNYKYAYKFVEKCELISIETENETVYFNYFTPNDYSSPYTQFYDFDRTEKFLETIIIKNKDDELIKTYKFDYYVNHFKRVFLKNIREKNSIDESIPPYTFNYLNPEYSLSLVHVFESDFWGFENSVENGGFVRRLFPEYNQARGLISEMYYPTGAYTKYFYEPNRYCFDTETSSPWYNEEWENTLIENGFTNFNNLRGGGYRIKKIENYSETGKNSKIFDYTINGKSSGRLTSYPKHEITYPFYNNSHATPYDRNVKSTNNNGLEQSYVFYEKITVFEDEKLENEDGYNGKNGKTEYIYNIQAPEYSTNISDGFPYDICTFKHKVSGLLKERIVYNDANKPISKQIINYDFSTNDNLKLKGLKVVAKRLDDDCLNCYTEFYKAWYEIKQESIKLNNKQNFTYATTESNSNIESNIQYSYLRGSEERKYPTKITKIDSNGDTIKTYMYYPEDYKNDGGVFDEMLARNIYSPTIKTETFKNGEKISGQKTTFGFHITASNDTLIVPISSEILEDNVYKTVKWFDKYNNKGNLLESHGIDGIHNCVFYNPDTTAIIATAVNATANSIFYTSFEYEDGNYTSSAKTGEKAHSGTYIFTLPEQFGTYTLSYWKLNGDVWEYIEKEIINTGNGATYVINDGIIDELRVHKPDAYMSTATYKPLIGKTSETNANGISVYYEYDSFGRLIKVFDQDKKMIKQNEYNISKSNFEILGSNTGASDCNTQLSIETNNIPPEKNITYEWFDDYCGGNIIGTGQTIDIQKELIQGDFQNIKTFARISIDGVCKPCKEHNITIYNEAHFMPAANNYCHSTYTEYGVELPMFETYNSELIFYFDDVYKGCPDNWSFTYTPIEDGGDISWINIEKTENGLGLKITLLDSGIFDRCDNNCREVIVHLTDANNNTKVFIFRQIKP